MILKKMIDLSLTKKKLLQNNRSDSSINFMIFFFVFFFQVIVNVIEAIGFESSGFW